MVLLPLQAALALQCLTRDPVSINPGSHANVNEFGKVVRYSPSTDPLIGTWRKPQSFANGGRKYITRINVFKDRKYNSQSKEALS